MLSSRNCSNRFSTVFAIFVTLSLCIPEQALTQSRNTFPMPNVIGLTIPEAERRVLAEGQVVRATSVNAQIVDRRPDARPAGQIIRQLESPGTPMRRYTDDVGGNYGEVTFQVVVSTGPDQEQRTDERNVDRAARGTQADNSRQSAGAEAIISGLLQGIVKGIAQSRDSFPMPDVVGLSVPEAERRVLAEGQAARATSTNAQIVDRRPDARPAGQIMQQLEAPGTPMRPYTDDVGGNYGEVTFRVVVSTGPPRPMTFPMPNVIGLTVPEAEQKVLSAGREIQASSATAVIENRQTDARPAGQIIRQLELPGTPMRRYTDDVGGNYGEVSFRVVVSTGPEPAPDFVGDTVDDARQYAGLNDIVVDVGDGQRNPRIPEGIVIRQNPAAGQPMLRRSVTVFPSTGFPLPNYVGEAIQQARRDSRRLAFVLEEQSEERADIPSGIVFEQIPGAGALLPLDGPVRVTVSGGWPAPDFLSLEESEATALAIARQVDLRITERRPDRSVRPGIVIDQNPLPRTLLAATRVVDVVLSAPDPTPRFTGLTEEEASDLAVRRNINLNITREASMKFAPGLVTDQSPDPGAPIPGNDMVSVVVSTGGPTPDFVGKTEEEARSFADGFDILLVEVAPGEHFDLSSGRVIEQWPVPGSEIPADRRVNISLSLGWPVAPDAVGRAFDQVRREFLALNPNATVEKSETMLTTEPAGTVISQDPPPGVKLGPRQRLSMVSSAPKPPWLWPVGGVILITIGLGVFAGLKSALSSPTPKSIHTENPGGVRLRVTKDHGIQTTEMKDGSDRDHQGAGEIVKIRVKVDLGEQSAGPVDDRGKKT